jgi:chromate transporter
MVIVTIVGALYMRYGEVDALRRILAGVTCGAVGLLIAAVFRMMLPLLRRRDIAALAIMMLVFIAIGIARLPLQVVLLAAIPVSIAVTYIMRRGTA